MTPRGKVDPARGLVRIVDGTIWLLTGPDDSFSADELGDWTPLVGASCRPPKPDMDADDIRAAIRYAVQKSRESGRRRGR